jgi:hypothetical protein
MRTDDSDSPLSKGAKGLMAHIPGITLAGSAAVEVAAVSTSVDATPASPAAAAAAGDDELFSME